MRIFLSSPSTLFAHLMLLCYTRNFYCSSVFQLFKIFSSLCSTFFEACNFGGKAELLMVFWRFDQWVGAWVYFFILEIYLSTWPTLDYSLNHKYNTPEKHFVQNLVLCELQFYEDHSGFYEDHWDKIESHFKDSEVY